MNPYIRFSSVLLGKRPEDYKKLWQDDLHAHIINDYQDGVAYKVLIDRYKLSKTTIMTIVRKAGCDYRNKVKKVPYVTKKAIIRKYYRGIKVKAIAQQHHMSVYKIHAIVEAYGRHAKKQSQQLQKST